MANAKIFEVISQIKQSKLLNDMFNHFVKDYDFYNGLVNALSEVDGVKSFVMPVKSTEVMAFTYCLLTEISQKKLQLTDLLDYFDNSKNYEKAYLKFCQDVLQPFKTYAEADHPYLGNKAGKPCGAVPPRRARRTQPSRYGEKSYGFTG